MKQPHHKLSPKKLLVKIKEIGYVQVEHALSLPFGYLLRLEEELKAGNRIPEEDVALLRIVSHFPWILEVAVNKYEDADKIMFENVIVKPEMDLQKRIIEKGW